ncbi:hypothetical protein MPER_01384, partial [Moniliophthora perniciosa FA553]
MDVEEEYFGISLPKDKGKGKADDKDEAEDEDEETRTEVEIREEEVEIDEIARASGVGEDDAEVIVMPHLTEYGDLLYGSESGPAADVQEELRRYLIEREERRRRKYLER